MSFSKKSLVFMLFLLACGHIQKVQSGSMHVMVYNVENLFDASHDQGKNDFAYLPKKFPGKKVECEKIKYYRYRNECLSADWNEAKLEVKLNQVAKVLGAYKEEFQVQPAILGLVEVENEAVVKRLAKKLGYAKTIVTNSPDKRGVDVALLVQESKSLKVINFREHILKDEYFKQRPTRNILEVTLKVSGKYELIVFVNHWPSLGNPTAARLVAAETLAKRITQLQAENGKRHFLVMGDFNTIPENHPHPFHTHLFKEGLLSDLHSTYMDDRKISWDKKNSQPPGSYFYGKNMQWNLLDRIFFSKTLKDQKGLELSHKSYRIFSKPFMTTSYIYQKKGDYLAGSQVQNTPKRYQHHLSDPAKQGFSDHFPLAVQLFY